ncbi:MAG: dienelactone hydrolase family protein [Deltaproteobacteria bacterium]|nr:dienelactone hydrolase family protein [Deltaproteobacteria bacterium]
MDGDLDTGSAPDLPGFTPEPFAHDGTTKLVYRAGAGPGVVVCHELPGITPPVLAFARRVVDAGFTVAMPWLLGEPGRPLSIGYNLREMARVCVSREIHVRAAHRSSPITDWLRALCRDLHARAGGPGVGVIGMCVTGNFGIATLLEPSVLAPVLCQPSLPLPLGRHACAALHASPDEIAHARARLADGSAGLLALRFTGDRLVPDARFDSLRRELPGAELIEIDSRPDNPHGIGRFAHSVVTNHLVDVEGHPTRAALERVLSFFAERLRGGPPHGQGSAIQ